MLYYMNSIIKIVNKNNALLPVDFNSKGWRKRLAKIFKEVVDIEPAYDDFKAVKQIYDATQKDLKNIIGTNELTILIVIISILCKIHLSDSFRSDSNKISAVINFIKKFITAKKSTVITFLCSHRGYGIDKHNDELVDKIPQEYLENFVNIVIALCEIFPQKQKTFSVYQQFPNRLVSLTMFPSMFKKFAQEGAINKLFQKINSHIVQLLSFKDKFSGKNINYKIIDVSSHSQDGLNYLEQRYGPNWYLKTNLDETDELENIALNFTLKSMKRFYSNEVDKFPDIVNENNYDSVAKEALVFARNYSNMSLPAKALAETVFYYGLGIKIVEDDLFYLGFERDHQLYQELAIEKGINDGQVFFNKDCKGAFLYARRTKDAKVENGIGIKGISFRQFWR